MSTTPKSGTTWLVYICHQLRTGGTDPDFEEFDKVITFLEVPLSVDGTPVDTPSDVVQPAEPRIFYSHVPYESLPKGGKVIHCVREPKDVFFSLVTYLDTLLLLKGRVSMTVMYDLMQVKGHYTANSLKDLLQWWEHRHDEGVLFVFFEDIREDHAGWTRIFAEFMGLSDEETLARVVRNTTHAEMAKHQSRFVDHSIIAECAKMFGDDPPSVPVGRVRKEGGKSGDGHKLPLEMQEAIDRAWQNIITPKLGFRNYDEMRAVWSNEVRLQRNLKTVH